MTGFIKQNPGHLIGMHVAYEEQQQHKPENISVCVLEACVR